MRETISLALESDLQTMIGEVARRHAYGCLREKELSVIEFVSGQDAFVSLPTGFGKCLVSSHCLDRQAHSVLYLCSPRSASILHSLTDDVLQY